MVDGDVDDNADALFVASGDECDEGLVATELGIDVEIVECIEAMYGTACTYRIYVQACHTEFGKIIKLVFYAIEVAIEEVEASGLFIRPRYLIERMRRHTVAEVCVVAVMDIVGLVSVAEPVRKDLIAVRGGDPPGAVEGRADREMVLRLRWKSRHTALGEIEVSSIDPEDEVVAQDLRCPGAIHMERVHSVDRRRWLVAPLHAIAVRDAEAFLHG